MNNAKSLGSVFKTGFPVVSIAAFVAVFACIFDTFELVYSAALYNILIILPIFGLFLMITRHFPLAVVFSSAVSFLIYYADQFVYAVRLTHIRFSDLSQISQGARVANRYHLIWNMELTRRLAVAVALCVLLILIYRYYKLNYKWKLPFFIGLGLFLCGGTVLISGVLPHSPETFDFTSETEANGLLYAWYCQYQESGLKEPEGYSRQRAEEILSAYTPADGTEDIDIIVIMNESLSDYSLLSEFPYQDPLPNIHSYVDNFFYGKLAVSVFGAGTCNTEYEFLTGNSMAFLPEGSMPYLQYVINEENSVAWDLGELGYSKTAIHPYYSEEWNRTQVYQLLGFDRFISGVDFGNTVVTNGMKATSRPSQNLISFGEGPLYVRGLISDQSCLERVLQESTEQSFIFAVTMQNHGGYTYQGEDFVNLEYVTEEDRTPPELQTERRGSRIDLMTEDDKEEETYKVNQFLTCTSLSDAAFKMLTDELEQRTQKTIVLMFGDHQPSLRIPEDYMLIDGFDELMYYDVPYMLWANFDIEFDAPEYTSPNYLSAILKKNAGLPLTAWDQYRLEMLEQYPVMTVNYILDAEGKKVSTETVNDYAIVQYMRMFG